VVWAAGRRGDDAAKKGLRDKEVTGVVELTAGVGAACEQILSGTAVVCEEATRE
jgi:hypothetical protein